MKPWKGLSLVAFLTLAACSVQPKAEPPMRARDYLTEPGVQRSAPDVVTIVPVGLRWGGSTWAYVDVAVVGPTARCESVARQFAKRALLTRSECFSIRRPGGGPYTINDPRSHGHGFEMPDVSVCEGVVESWSGYIVQMPIDVTWPLSEGEYLVGLDGVTEDSRFLRQLQEGGLTEVQREPQLLTMRTRWIAH